MNRILTVQAAALVLLAAQNARAESMVCGAEVITEDDTEAALLEHCGEPADRDGNRWYYRVNQETVRVVHLEAGSISLIETQRD